MSLQKRVIIIHYCVCRMLQSFYSSNPATAVCLQSNTHVADKAAQKCFRDPQPVSQTLPAVLFWSLLDIPLWFTASGLLVYIGIVIAGAVSSLTWAVLMS